MLKKVRVVMAAIFFSLVTLLFLDFTGSIHAWFGWMAKVQFLPAVLSLNLVAIVFVLALTLLFGRVYCSVICPLGVMQDIISWFSSKNKKNRFSYSPAKTKLRLAMLAVLVVAVLAGIGSVVALLAPYSSYGRIANNLFVPIYQLGNNLLALIASHVDSYAFYSVDVWIRSIPTFVLTFAIFAAIFVLAWRGGRTYCNTICPVGTVLGYVARFSFLKPVIDADKCVGCSLCSRNCKSSCIDFKNKTIDYTRCVSCLNCISTCKKGAITYARPSASAPLQTEEAVDSSRRGFLSLSAFLLASGAVKAADKTIDGGLAPIIEKKAPKRVTPITPPGSLSASNMASHCTGCQLCVSACPNGVLRPSTDLVKLMQPESSYEKGYCRPECTKCSEVCPAGAIKPITKEEKTAIQIGHAVFVKDLCVSAKGVSCGNCERHCPTGAIQMISSDPNNEAAPRIPSINVERCIGCGACEHLCPSSPDSAIYVEGHEVHRSI